MRLLDLRLLWQNVSRDGGAHVGGKGPMRRQESLRYLAENLTLLFLYFVAGRIGLALAIQHPSVSLVWPPSGIALAALILLGTQAWPTVFLGAFLVNVTTAASVPLALMIAVGNTLEAALGAVLVNRFAGGRRAFERPENVLRFVGGAALLATCVSATLGVASLMLAGRATAAQAGALWQTWWLGDAVGVVVAAPFLLLWSDARPPAWRGRALELAGLAMSLLGVGLVVFNEKIFAAPGRPTLAYLCVVPLTWAALRFGQREVSASIVVLCGIAIWNTIQNSGPFAGGTPTQSLVLLQLFLGVVVTMALGVGAHAAHSRSIERALEAAHTDLEQQVEDRTREISSTHLELRKSEARFRNFIEAAQDPLLIVDRRGRIVLVNARAETAFGYRRDELFGKPIEMLLPERFRGQHEDSREEYFRFPRLRSMGEGPDLHAMRRDGTEFPVEIMLSPLETEKGTLVSAAIRDITRRRQAEESVARLAAVVASSDEAIISTDADGFIATWNAAAERVFGYPAAEVMGRSSAVLTAPGHAGEMEAILERLKRREQVRHETQVLRKDGEVLDVALTAFPVLGANGRLLGFSTMFRDITEQKRSEATRRESEVLASQVQEMSRHTHEIALLSELGDVLRAAVRVTEAYPVIPRFLKEFFPGESGALYEFDLQHGLYSTALVWGEAPPPEDAFGASDCWALRRARPHEVTDPAGEMICGHLGASILAGSLCIPLMARGRTLGLLHLRGRPDRRGRNGSDGVRGEYRQRLASTVAQQISSALHDLTIQETLREQASRDPLTGLFNRRYMEETLHRELFRAARRKHQVGFLLFDLDHFKRLNDRFGHAAGDAALREVSAFVHRRARVEDILCRYGGEEFLLVLADCSSRNAMKRAETIREGIRGLRLEHEGRPLGEITVSVGVALFPDHGRTLEDLFQAADAALYEAKKTGRDRIVAADTLPWVVIPGHGPESDLQH